MKEEIVRQAEIMLEDLLKARKSGHISVTLDDNMENGDVTGEVYVADRNKEKIYDLGEITDQKNRKNMMVLALRKIINMDNKEKARQFNKEFGQTAQLCTILKIDKNGDLALAMETGWQMDHTIRAHCSVRHQPVTERSNYKVGESLIFFIYKTEPDPVHGIRACASRTAKDLSVCLLSDLTGRSDLKVKKRIPGRVSKIQCILPPPPTEVIKKVARELGEHIHIHQVAS